MTESDAAKRLERCPHCGTAADVEPAGLLRQRCLVCGGPRVPVDDPDIPRNGNEVAALRRVQRARVRMLLWRVAGAVIGGLGSIPLLFVLAVLVFGSPTLPAAILSTLFALLPPAFGLYAFWRGARHKHEIVRDLDRAWGAVLDDVVAARGAELDAAQVARLMRLPEPAAEQLLAERAVERLLASDSERARLRVAEALPELEEPAPSPAAEQRHERE